MHCFIDQHFPHWLVETTLSFVINYSRGGLWFESEWPHTSKRFVHLSESASPFSEASKIKQHHRIRKDLAPGWQYRAFKGFISRPISIYLLDMFKCKGNQCMVHVIWSTYIFRTWYWWNQSFTCMRDGSFFSPSHCYTGGPSNESFRRSAKDNRFLLPKWIKPCWWVVSWIWSGIHQCTSKNGANMHTTDLIPWPITWHSLPKIGHIYMHICIFDPWSCEGILSSIWIFIFNKEWWDLWGHTAVNIYGKNPKDHIQQPVRCKIQYMSKQEKPFNQINKGYIPFTKRINEVNGWFFSILAVLNVITAFRSTL